MQHTSQRSEGLLHPELRLLHAYEAHRSTNTTTPPSIASLSNAGSASLHRRRTSSTQSYAARATTHARPASTEGALAPRVRSAWFDRCDDAHERRMSFRRRSTSPLRRMARSTRSSAARVTTHASAASRGSSDCSIRAKHRSTRAITSPDAARRSDAGSTSAHRLAACSTQS
jgi:hypothetical protein